MSIQPDIAFIVASAKNPEITAIEARLAELQKLEHDVGAEWLRWAEESDPSIDRVINPKTPASREAARMRAQGLAARRAELAREAADLRLKKDHLAPASLAAIGDALAPVRERATQDIRNAVSALYAAIALHNSTSTALLANGGVMKYIPGHLPFLDHIISMAAKR
jgi:hypothetical protein